MKQVNEEGPPFADQEQADLEGLIAETIVELANDFDIAVFDGAGIQFPVVAGTILKVIHGPTNREFYIVIADADDVDEGVPPFVAGHLLGKGEKE